MMDFVMRKNFFRFFEFSSIFEKFEKFRFIFINPVIESKKEITLVIRISVFLYYIYIIYYFILVYDFICMYIGFCY